MADYERVMAMVASNHLVKGVAPYVEGQVLLSTEPPEGNEKVVGPLIRGVDPRYEPNISKLLSSIARGTNNLHGYSMLVGRGLAESLQVNVGDPLAIYSIRAFKKWQNSRKHGGEEAPVADDYKVTGIFNLGFYEFDSSYVVTSLANAQDLYDLGERVHGLAVALVAPERAVEAQIELEQVLGGEFMVTTWQQENSGILDALVVEKNMMFYLLFFITIVAAFGITSGLITFVVQKTREIGTLKALGATAGQIMWLFLSQSLVVGVLGVSAGYGLGLLAVIFRNDFLRFMRRTVHFELFPERIYNFRELPALIDPKDILLICGGSLVICLLAGLLPAWNAGRLHPVEALRHE